MTRFGELMTWIKPYLAPGSVVIWAWDVDSGGSECWTASCRSISGECHVVRKQPSGEEALRHLYEASRGNQ